jgi:hypothetical protein
MVMAGLSANALRRPPAKFPTPRELMPTPQLFEIARRVGYTVKVAADGSTRIKHPAASYPVWCAQRAPEGGWHLGQIPGPGLAAQHDQWTSDPGHVSGHLYRWLSGKPAA